jgi:hypothetical protein
MATSLGADAAGASLMIAVPSLAAAYDKKPDGRATHQQCNEMHFLHF